jgi:hypothetical protein
MGITAHATKTLGSFNSLLRVHRVLRVKTQFFEVPFSPLFRPVTFVNPTSFAGLTLYGGPSAGGTKSWCHPTWGHTRPKCGERPRGEPLMIRELPILELHQETFPPDQRYML